MTFVAIGVLLVIIYYYVKKWLIARNIPHYGPKEADSKVRTGNSIYLDVRKVDERDHEKIRNSYHIPVDELKGRLNELERYKQKEIICYCSTGTRSLNAAAFLNKKGFKVANLKGGMLAWNKKDKLM